MGVWSSGAATSNDDTFTGDASDELADGLAGDDILNGGDGRDDLRGGAGDDTLNGGAGDDEMADGRWGGSGVDIMHGNAGNDSVQELYTQDGDQIFGDEGNDVLSAAFTVGALRLDGGDGDDVLVATPASGSAGALTIIGAGGEDYIRVTTYSSLSTSVISGGANSDTILVQGPGLFRITLGGGRDWLSVSSGSAGLSADARVMDFTPGNTGDVLELTDLALATNWNGAANPLADGHVRLLQSGADTLVQVNEDGAGADWLTGVRLVGVTASALTDINLGGWAVNGAAPPPVTKNGGANADELNGTIGPDTINGLSGADTLDGGVGNDILNGGDDGDDLRGYIGDDILNGGAGDDEIADGRWGGSGVDIMHGNAGNDSVTELHTQDGDQIFGDEGDDQLSAAFTVGALRLDGGDGDDVLDATPASLSAGVLTIIGAGGEDQIRVTTYSSLSTSVIDGGADNDTVSVEGPGLFRVTLGDGGDRFEVREGSSGFSSDAQVLDFTAGASGDVFGLDFLSFTSWNGVDNPFVVGFVRVLQSGADTLIQFNDDAAGRDWITTARLVGVDAIGLIAANLDGWTNPEIAQEGTASADVLNGTSAKDHLYGAEGADTLSGAAARDILEGESGDDVLNGGADADAMRGGTGNDTYYVDNIGDLTEENLDSGVDTVVADRSWAVSSNIERVFLSGSGDFNVAGNGLANNLKGNSGDNWLNGSFGKDTLTGGGGRDSFIFNRALGPNNIDTITDYDVPRDVIRIDNAIFTGIGAAGAFSVAMFNTGAAATEADDHIVYDPATGKLYFDIDGSGAAAQVHFATLTGAPTGMSAAEFIVI